MYHSHLESATADKLFDAILALKDREECYRFFEDLCTIAEFQAITQRFEVALMLTDKFTYQEIAKKTGASTATICRVNRGLQYGSEGYQTIISRLKSDD